MSSVKLYLVVLCKPAFQMKCKKVIASIGNEGRKKYTIIRGATIIFTILVSQFYDVQ